MNCLHCNYPTVVIDTRHPKDGSVRRRRACYRCKERFTTSEIPIQKRRATEAKAENLDAAISGVSALLADLKSGRPIRESANV